MTYIGNLLRRQSLKTGFWIIVFIIAFKQESFGESQDSIPPYTLIISPRLHSGGFFPFTGALLNRDLTADINIFYNRKSYGFFLFQSRDLQDSRSYVNYFQPGIFKNINISPKFNMRAFFGYIFSQTDGFKDKDSDYYAALSQYWDITKKIRLENTMLFFDLTISKKLANRMLLSFLVKDFKLDLYVWQRYVFEDGSGATSASMAVTIPKIKISETVSIQNTLSYQGYLTSAKPDFALRDGFVFTMAVPIAVK